MNKLILIILINILRLSCFAQWTTNGNNITTDKNVGIGISNSQYKLDVVGNTNVKGVLIVGDTQRDISLTRILKLRSSSSAGAASTIHFDFNEKLAAFIQSKTEDGKTTDFNFYTSTGNKLTIKDGGNVGIGTENPQYKLDVKGNFRATEVKIEDVGSWSDFVFDKDYKLPSLSDVETHINIHKHLLDVPSEAQVKEEGINVVEMQAKLLQKIEELTLYVIKQDKEIQNLKEMLLKK